MTKSYIATKKFHFYEQVNKAMKLTTYEVGEIVPLRIVKLYGLIDKNYVGLV